MTRYAIPVSELPRSAVGTGGSYVRRFEGESHAVPSVSLMLSEIQPGEGPGWHRHAYDEVFVITEGEATYMLENEVITAGIGAVVLVPAGTPHRFINSGQGTLRQTAIHAAPRIVIEWLGDSPGMVAR